MTEPEKEKENSLIKEAMKVVKKERIVQWVKEHIDEADKCLVVLAKRDPEGGLQLNGIQIGFQYVYEIDGFVQMIPDTFMREDGEEVSDDSDRE